MIDCQGRLDVKFSGTLLVSKLENGELKIVEGKLKKEYDKNGRAVYTGSARIIVTGKWRGVQWFGSDMSAVFYGAGFARITGEFDRNLNTGDYWYDSDPPQSFPSASVISLTVPKANYGADTKLKPVPRVGGTASGGN